MQVGLVVLVGRAGSACRAGNTGSAGRPGSSVRAGSTGSAGRPVVQVGLV